MRLPSTIHSSPFGFRLASAIINRMRAGTTASPKPGITTNAAPRRVKTAMNAKTSDGRNCVSGIHDLPPAMIWSKMNSVNLIIVASMNGMKMIIVMNRTISFGTKVSVISWIWVIAWSSEMATPTTRPIAIGGPQMIRLADGRFLAAVRLYDGKVRTSLCWADPKTGAFEEFLTLPSGGDTSYAGLVPHEGLLWVSYYSSHEGKTSIYLAKVRLPKASSAPKSDTGG